MGTLIRKMCASHGDAEPAAERRADDRAENGGNAEQRQPRAFSPREGVEQNSLATWLQAAASEPLMIGTQSSAGWCEATEPSQRKRAMQTRCAPARGVLQASR
jgi:hypothetical protein